MVREDRGCIFWCVFHVCSRQKHEYPNMSPMADNAITQGDIRGLGSPLYTGADPRMVRIGTGPPFWQINHANSAYFRLFSGYFRVISATRPPLLDLGPSFLHILDPALLVYLWIYPIQYNNDPLFRRKWQHISLIHQMMLEIKIL